MAVARTCGNIFGFATVFIEEREREKERVIRME